MSNNPSEFQSWPEIERSFPEANFLQSPAWARTNELIGHEVLTEDFSGRAWCLMIVKNAKRGRYLEIPAGPLLDWQDRKLVDEVFRKIREVAKSRKCVFIRLRPQLTASLVNLQLLENLGAKKAPMHLHAEHTIILDLEKSEEELLADLRRQTRYEVRRSAKLGLRVDWSNSEEIFREFHDVQTETATRQHFVPPDLKTLLAEREGFADDARMYVARTEDGEPIAYSLILMSGAEADYYEAASTNLNRKLPGAYALQWQVIKDLKELGFKRYNLWGIAPPGAKDHRYSGVTTFKSGFGGEMVEYVPAHDIVINRPRYLLNLLIERVRKRVRHL